MLADGTRKLFAAAFLAERGKLLAHVRAIEITAIPIVPMLINGAPEELGEQNLREGFLDRIRRCFEGVRDLYLETVFVEANEAVGADEVAEANGNLRQGRARLQLAKHARVNLFGSLEQQRRLDFGTQETLR